MINIWTRTVAVRSTGKTYVVAFSTFKPVLTSAITNLACMDDCEILRTEWNASVDLAGNAHRITAEHLRDDYNEGEFEDRFLYGGMTLLPSGHRRFHMLGEAY